MPKFRAVGFDWGGVLNGKPSNFYGKRAAELMGVQYDDYLQAYFHHNKRVNRGEINWQELWQLVCAELGRADLADEIHRLSMLANQYDPNHETLSLVDELHKLGYKTGLLSNNTIEKAHELREQKLDAHFDVFDISAETGLVKPEPEAFAHFAAQLGVELSELVFIDDSPKSLSTASTCGFTPILFESNVQLRATLHSIGVL